MAKRTERESLRTPTPADMEVTPERALMIKRALIRQYADQMKIDITGWQEIENGKLYTVKIINDKAVVQSVTDFVPGSEPAAMPKTMNLQTG